VAEVGEIGWGRMVGERVKKRDPITDPDLDPIAKKEK
jgi:hypothetical protein